MSERSKTAAGQADLSAPQDEQEPLLKADRRRMEIINIAVRHINAHGMQGLNVSEVASAVGMTKANLTYYFRRKDDLVASCYDIALDAYMAMIRQAANAKTPSARVGRLVDAFFAQAAKTASGEGSPLAILGDVRALDEPLQSRIVSRFSDLLFSAAALLDRVGCKEPEILRTVPRAELLLVQLFWSAAWLDHYPVSKYPRAAKRLHDIMTRGLASPAVRWNEGWADEARSIAGAVGCAIEPAEFYRAATRVVNIRGYRGASLDRIAEAMDATKGAIYHQFESKDDLIAALFKRSFDLMWALIEEVDRRDDTSFGRLFRLVSALVAFQASDNGPFLRETALLSLPPVMRGEVMAQWRRVQIHLSSLISDGVAEGDVRPVDPVLAAHAIIAAVNGADEINRFVPENLTFDAVNICARPILFGLLYDDRTVKP